jgi:hypothetical protein
MPESPVNPEPAESLGIACLPVVKSPSCITILDPANILEPAGTSKVTARRVRGALQFVREHMREPRYA